MLLVQKFENFSEIDADFYPGIEDLLFHEVPHLDWVKKHEFHEGKSNPQEERLYYLFFSQHNNHPVGIAGIVIKNIPLTQIFDLPRAVLLKISGFNNSIKVLESNLFGLGVGHFFEPSFKEEGEEQLKKILKTLEDRHEIALKIINHLPQSDLIINKKHITHEIDVPDIVYKNSPSYDEFSHQFSRSSEDLRFKEYKNFSSLYDLYKNEEFFKQTLPESMWTGEYHLLHSSWVVLTYKKIFQGLILFIKGQHLDLFCEIYAHDEASKHLPLMIQYAIDRLYNFPELKRLKFLGSEKLLHEHQNILKNQILPYKKQLVSVSTSSMPLGFFLSRLRFL
jgi:hypothetical protein